MRGTGRLDRPREQRLAGPVPHARIHPAPRLRLVAVLLARFVLTLAITVWLAVLAPTAFGFRTTTVMSDSMAPGVLAGDAVVVRPVAAQDLRIGQVLLVDDPDQEGRLRLHRLVGRVHGELRLKGDANPTADGSTVTPAQVRGAAVLRVPLAGLPDYWLRTGAILPFAAFLTALLSLGAIACADLRASSPGGASSRLLRPGLRRKAGVGGAAGLVLAVAVAAVAPPGPAWAIFTGVATSSANTIGASTLFRNCPSRAAGLPTPVLWYAYTANSGTTESDISSNGPAANGTVAASITRVPGYCDRSAASPYLQLPSSNASNVTAVSQTSSKSSASAAFSISLWMNPAASGGVLADFTNSNGTGNQNLTDRRIYYTSDGLLAFGARFGSNKGTPGWCTAPAPTIGVWHSVVGIGSSSGVLTLYVDGVQVCSYTGSGGYAPQAAAAGGFWAFGAERSLGAGDVWGESSTVTGFVGGLDETTVYDSALTTTDVSNLLAAGH